MIFSYEVTLRNVTGIELTVLYGILKSKYWSMLNTGRVVFPDIAFIFFHFLFSKHCIPRNVWFYFLVLWCVFRSMCYHLQHAFMSPVATILLKLHPKGVDALTLDIPRYYWVFWGYNFFRHFCRIWVMNSSLVSPTRSQ